MKRDYWADFEPRMSYHIYNQSVGGAKLFLTQENYDFFLRRWKKYIHPFVETYAYCLIPNHFHFLGVVRIEEELDIAIAKIGTKSAIRFQEGKASYSEVILQQFSNFFNSYASANNVRRDRPGALLQKRFKRILLKNEDEILWMLHYIHQNPLHHHLVEDYLSWQYNSYKAYLSKSPTLVEREEALQLFDPNDNASALKDFITFHEEQKDWDRIKGICLE